MRRLFICAALVGCGGDGDHGSVALDDFGMAIGVASCGKQFECCTDAEIIEQYMNIKYNGHSITTEAECVELTTAVFTSLAVLNYKESLAMGRIEYDGDAAADCVAAIEGATCTEYNSRMISGTSDCRPFILSKVGDGGACTQSYECTSDNCVGATVVLDGPDTDGMCMPMPGEGQPCEDDCAEGFHCAFDSSTGGETCQALAVDGAMCIVDSECASDYCDKDADVCATEPPLCHG
jgi:hypothetical protein